MANSKETKVLKFGKNGIHLYVPSTVRDDSKNPIKLGMSVVVEVDGNKMTITPKITTMEKVAVITQDEATTRTMEDVAQTNKRKGSVTPK